MENRNEHLQQKDQKNLYYSYSGYSSGGACYRCSCISGLILFESYYSILGVLPQGMSVHLE